jgi:hypothetical protein
VTATPQVGTGGVFSSLVTIDPASVSATACLNVAVTVTGAKANDLFTFYPPAALNAGLVYGGVVSVTTDTVTIDVCNLTAAPIDDTARVWEYFWTRRNQ